MRREVPRPHATTLRFGRRVWVGLWVVITAVKKTACLVWDRFMRLIDVFKPMTGVDLEEYY